MSAKKPKRAQAKNAGGNYEGLGRSLPTSFRFSEQAKDILWKLSEFEGLSQSSFIEQLLRREARERGLLPGTVAATQPRKGTR